MYVSNMGTPTAQNVPWKFVVELDCCQKLCWCWASWASSFLSLSHSLAVVFYSQSLFQMQPLPSELSSGSGIEVPLFISSLRCFSLNKVKQSLFMSLSVSLCLHTYKSFKPKISAIEKWVVTVYMGGTSGKESASHCGRQNRHGLNPWVRKIPWRRSWKPTPVFLSGESHGQRSLAGSQSMGSQRVRHY